MEYRSDWSLELQLEQTERLAEDDEVRSSIARTIAYMNSGKGRNRRAGTQLAQR